MTRSKRVRSILERFIISILEASELTLFIILGATVFIGMGFLAAKLWSVFGVKSELSNVIESKKIRRCFYI